MRAPFTALSKTQSEKIMRGDFPPNSKVTGLIPLAAISIIYWGEKTEQDVAANTGNYNSIFLVNAKSLS